MFQTIVQKFFCIMKLLTRWVVFICWECVKSLDGQAQKKFLVVVPNSLDGTGMMLYTMYVLELHIIA